jgi:hypothetical protein
VPSEVGLLFILIVSAAASLTFQFSSNHLIILDIFAVFVYLFTFLKLFIHKSKSKPFYLFYVSIYIFWTLLSCLFIEFGSYISEQNRFGYASGSALRLSTYGCIFLVTTTFFFKKFSAALSASHLQRSATLTPSKRLILISIAYLSLFILLIYGLINGFPVFTLTDRFSYWGEQGSLLASLVQKLLYIQPPLFFVFFAFRMNRQPILTGYLFACPLILFSMGDKFSGQLDLLLYALSGYLLAQALSPSSGLHFYSKRFFLNALVLAALLIIFPIIGYSLWHKTSNSDLFELIVSRIFALQGHTYWGFDTLISASNDDLFRFNPSVVFSKTSLSSPSGLHALMYEVSDSSFVYNTIKLGIRFTQGGFAVLLNGFGFVGAFLIVVLFALIYSFFSCLALVFCKHSRLTGLLSLSILFNSAFVNSFLMGDYYYLYGPVAIASFLVLLANLLTIYKPYLSN